MALSPWHVANRMSCEEVAALLGGYDIAAAKAGYVKDHHLHELNEWGRVIVSAAQAGDLKPTAVVMRWDAQCGTSEEGYPHYEESWEECHGDEWLDVHHTYLRLTLERQEVYRWLRTSGIANDDIPEALRVMPAERQQQSEELHPRREGTYQRIIATLLAMQYSAKELEEPFRLADQVLDDCQAQDVKAPASRNTLGDLFKKLPRVQKAPLE